MTEQKPIILPDNAAGRLIFGVLMAQAKKMCADGKAATRAYAETRFPNHKLVDCHYANKQFHRVIRPKRGALISVVYDYMTHSTSSMPYQAD